MKAFITLVISVLVLLFGILAAGCDAQKDPAEPNESIPSVSMHSDYPYYDSIKTLVDKSDLVFKGKTVNIEYTRLDISEEDAEYTANGDTELIPYTIYTIEIDDMYKGKELADNIIKVKRPGGIVDNVNYELEGATKIVKGKEYLFLVVTFDNAPASFVNADQSAYLISENESDVKKIISECGEVK